MTTTDVENFPGFREGVQGPELVAAMRDQAQRFGAVLVREEAIELSLGRNPKRVTTAEGGEYEADSVILATGSRYRRLGLPDEARLAGMGVSWCATCDGAFYRGQELVVVGGGDSAVQEAIFLTRFATRVTIIHRRGTLRASKVLQARAFENPKISLLWDTEVTGLDGEARLSGVRTRNVKTGEEGTLPAGGLFVAIGHDPNTEMILDQLDLDENHYIRVQHPTTATSVAGVFACGDVVDHRYRQAVTAAGTGCAAALDAEEYLSLGGHATGAVASSAARSPYEMANGSPTNGLPRESTSPPTRMPGSVPAADPETKEVTTMGVLEVTDDSFAATVLEADRPVLVDFWASWCGPCQLMFSVMDDLAQSRPDLMVVKVNVDESPVTAERYEVTSLPTLKLFDEGAVVHTVHGAMTQTKLLAEIGPLLGGPASEPQLSR